jgi:hypothetical protein
MRNPAMHAPGFFCARTRRKSLCPIPAVRGWQKWDRQQQASLLSFTNGGFRDAFFERSCFGDPLKSKLDFFSDQPAKSSAPGRPYGVLVSWLEVGILHLAQ